MRNLTALQKLERASTSAIRGLATSVAALEVLFSDAALPEASRIEKRLDDISNRLLVPLAGDVDDMFALARAEKLQVHAPTKRFDFRTAPTTAFGALRVAAESMEAMVSVLEAFRPSRDAFVQALARDGAKTMSEVASEMKHVAKDVESAAARIRKRGRRR